MCASISFNSGLGDILKFKDLNIKMLGFSAKYFMTLKPLLQSGVTHVQL